MKIDTKDTIRDISSLKYDWVSATLLLVCKGVHDKLKSRITTCLSKIYLLQVSKKSLKAQTSTNKGHEIISIPRECDQRWSNWQFKYIAGFLRIESR